MRQQKGAGLRVHESCPPPADPDQQLRCPARGLGIALDPELLGKVFENLLASYNEETKTTARKRLRLFLTDDHLKQLKRVQLIDDILACTERVLNPAAHSGNPPLYQKEVTDALNLIKQLDSALICAGSSTT